MKHTIPLIFLVAVILSSCNDNSESKRPNQSIELYNSIELPRLTVEKSMLYYNNNLSTWTMNDQPFSGYAVDYYPDSTLKEKIGIFDGKKQNQSIKWYPDGHLRQIENYHDGRLHGIKKVWSTDTNHILISQLKYAFGKLHGAQKKWYLTGEIHKILQLNMGKEEGIQQAFRENGDLYANYEAKNGRVFGMKKGKLCFGLENENIQRN